MEGFRQTGNTLIWEGSHEIVKIEPWGKDSLRVRATISSDIRDDLPGALLELAATTPEITLGNKSAHIRNGAIRAEISAPVLYEGARSRAVYLPAGTHWTDAWTGQTFEGRRQITADAPLERIPLYLRAGAKLPIRAGG